MERGAFLSTFVHDRVRRLPLSPCLTDARTREPLGSISDALPSPLSAYDESCAPVYTKEDFSDVRVGKCSEVEHPHDVKPSSVDVLWRGLG